MAPSATSEPVVVPIIDDRKLESKQLPVEAESVKEPESYSGVKIGSAQPLKPRGVLDQYKSFDITPIIGREFAEDVQLVDLIQAENSDELLRDLAITSILPVTFFIKLFLICCSFPKKRSRVPKTNDFK